MEQQRVESMTHRTGHRNRFVQLFGFAEGRILLTGLALMSLYFTWLGAVLIVAPQRCQLYLGMTATHVLFGRAAGMSFGYALDLGHGIVIPANMVIETVLVLLCYPLFAFGLKRMLVFDWLKRVTDRIERTAGANHQRIRRFGIPGLFVFVCFPFWMTGPLVGCIIGHLMGLRPWLNMGVVIGGTCLAICGWGVVLLELNEHIASYSAYGPMILVAILILVALVVLLMERRRHDGDDR